MTILVADDDAEAHALAREAFRAHAVRFVAGAGELLRYLRREGPHAASPRPGLILLDLQLPGEEGCAALRALKADPQLRAIPVVVLAGEACGEADVLRAYDLGAASCVTRPGSAAGLGEVLCAVGRYWLDVVELPR